MQCESRSSRRGAKPFARAGETLVVRQRPPHHLSRCLHVNARRDFTHARHVSKRPHFDDHVARRGGKQPLRLATREHRERAAHSARRRLLQRPYRSVRAQLAAKAHGRTARGASVGAAQKERTGSRVHARCSLKVATQLRQLCGAINLRHHTQPRLREHARQPSACVRRASIRSHRWACKHTHAPLAPPNGPAPASPAAAPCPQTAWGLRSAVRQVKQAK